MTGTDFLLGRGAGVYINQEGNNKVTLGWPNPRWVPVGRGLMGNGLGTKSSRASPPSIEVLHLPGEEARPWLGGVNRDSRKDGKTHQSQGRS